MNIKEHIEVSAYGYIKPCPVCGLPGALVGDRYIRKVACSNIQCGVESPRTINDTAEEAVEAWNKRAPDADTVRRCAAIAGTACLVDPDCGAPTEAERLVCEEAERRILASLQTLQDVWQEIK